MPVHQFFIRPRKTLWEVDAGDGYRMGFSSKEAAITSAIEAAASLTKRPGSVAVFVVEPGVPPVQIWPEAQTEQPGASHPPL